mgnify:FL=1
MTALVSVLAYVVIIVIGAALRSLRLVPNDLSRSIGFLVLNITLPCAIVTFLNGVTLPMSLLATVLIPIGATWVMIFVAWLLTHRQPDAKTAVPFAVLNMSSFNVGTFGMPFTMGLVSPLGFLVVCLFDVGNSIMCTGGTYAFLCRKQGGALAAIANVFRTLARSAPLWTYVVVIALSLLEIRIPDAILHFCKVVGGANTFLSMLFIGLSINLAINWGKFRKLIWLMIVRYAVNAVLAALLYWLLPFPLDVRQAIAVTMMTPLAVMGVVFTMKAGLDYETAANINSLSVFVSVVIMCAMLASFAA